MSDFSEHEGEQFLQDLLASLSKVMKGMQRAGKNAHEKGDHEYETIFKAGYFSAASLSAAIEVILEVGDVSAPPVYGPSFVPETGKDRSN